VINDGSHKRNIDLRFFFLKFSEKHVFHAKYVKEVQFREGKSV